MCADYTPSRNDAMSQHFGVDRHLFDFPPEAFPGYLAPIIRAVPGQRGQHECVPACFGMVPHWADLKLARSTYNARTETVDLKPSFRNAWQRRQLCIVPAENFFEPNYATGKAQRWRIEHADGQPLGIAGIWEWRPGGPDSAPLLSFSMLTINADAHPLMRQFHKPDEEKRMVVILEPQHYHGWLSGELIDAEQLYLPYPDDRLAARADPMTRPVAPPRQSPARRPAPSDSGQQNLFGDN